MSNFFLFVCRCNRYRHLALIYLSSSLSFTFCQHFSGLVRTQSGSSGILRCVVALQEDYLQEGREEGGAGETSETRSDDDDISLQRLPLQVVPSLRWCILVCLGFNRKHTGKEWICRRIYRSSKRKTASTISTLADLSTCKAVQFRSICCWGCKKSSLLAKVLVVLVEV